MKPSYIHAASRKNLLPLTKKLLVTATLITPLAYAMPHSDNRNEGSSAPIGKSNHLRLLEEAIKKDDINRIKLYIAAAMTASKMLSLELS